LAVTLRGCEELIPKEDWLQKLAKSEATGVPLRIKLGLDPTAPDIHIGHTVVLNKMRQLQDLGHQVIFLIGDFTSLIGDPSGRNSTRPPLTSEQIKLNAETYYKQASLVLDPNKTEIRYNSEWSLPLGSMGMIQLAAKYTVARMMERNDFHDRFKAGTPISACTSFCTRSCRATTRWHSSPTWSWVAPTRSSTCSWGDTCKPNTAKSRSAS
jgi:tyrosyl-tRNA synthetase